MINKIKKIYKTRFEAYGGEHVRDTFSGELRYELGRLSYLIFFTAFVWLPYIPNDLMLHQYPRFAVSIRLTFSLLSIALIVLRFTKILKNRPDIMFKIAMTYLYLSTALVTATSGEYATSYIGGFVFVIIMPAFAPFPLKFIYSFSTTSIILFFLTGSLTGMAFSDVSVRYSVTDLVVAYMLSLVMSLTLYKLRLRSWEQRLKLQETVKQNEKSLATIFDLANKAESQARHKSEFLAKMSHEIRTPMNAITGMAELALREKMSEKARENILTIKQASANLLSIINDILDISKIESGKMEIVEGDYFFDSLINDVISIIRMRVVDTQVRFVANIDCNIPNALFGDETRIRQILLNILNNAVKFTEEGHVSFTVLCEDIDEEQINLLIEISDSGVGMKAGDIDKLFKDFVQIDIHNQKHIEGTGLGLAITHSLVKAMDGDISVESEYGKGSTFTIRISQEIRSPEKFVHVENPDEKRVLVYELRDIYADSIVCTIDNLGVECTLVSSDAELREKLTSGIYPFIFVASTLYENTAKICAELKTNAVIALLAGFGEYFIEQNLTILAMPVYSKTVANLLNGVIDSYTYIEAVESVARFIAPDAEILVVDDINTNLSVAEGLLLPYKMGIDLRLSGIEAIEAATNKKYDLIFMDHMMPGVDGIEAVKRIRQLDGGGTYYQDLPIIVLTANAVSGTKEMFLDSGFNDFLSKPIDTIKLNAILEKWIPKEKQVKGVVHTHSGNASDYSMENMEIDGIDVKKGVTISGGNMEKYKKTLGIFRMDGQDKIKQLKTCVMTENLNLYVTYVHALKSAAANVGATSLSELAEALEEAGLEGDYDYIMMHNDILLSALDTLLEKISCALKGGEDKTHTEPTDTELMKNAFKQLYDALESVSPRKIKEAVKIIQPMTQAGGAGGIIEDILQKTLTGDYAEASSMIEKLLHQENIRD